MDNHPPKAAATSTFNVRENFLSRKFNMMVGLVVVSSGFLYSKRMKAEEWITFNKWVFGIYSTGNVSSKISQAMREQGQGQIELQRQAMPYQFQQLPQNYNFMPQKQGYQMYQ